MNDVPIGIFDYLIDYPEENTVFIGLYMIHGKYHRKGMGREIFLEIEKEFQKIGIWKLRLAVIQENRISYQFWNELGFQEKERKIWKNKL